MEPLAPVSSRSWQIAKLVIQGISIVCCIIVIGLSTSVSWDDTLGLGTLTIPISAATAAWTIAELITLYVRRKGAPGRGIHPGVHVGVQLVIFLVMILAVFFSSMLWRSIERALMYCNEWPRDPKNPDYVMQNTTGRNNDGYGRTIMYYYCPETYRDHINNPSYRSIVQALIAFNALLWLIHFTLFVRACVETQRRNSERPVMMYPPPTWPTPYIENYPPSGIPQGEPGPGPMKEVHYRYQ